MSTPAERYAAAAARHAARPARARPASPPAWTSRSTTSRCGPARRSRQGRGVLVAAPTGAGKTIVGEFAVHLALATGRKAFYTTPDQGAVQPEVHTTSCASTAPTNVGLLTGDSSINGEAPVVVMTTEVLRNMLYAGSPHAARPRLRRDGRGALPRRPVPRRGLGGGHHPPARGRAGGLAVGDGQQRRGVRRLAGRGARRPRGRSSRSTGRCRCGST